MERSERVATNVTPEKKRDFKIAAMRRDMKEAELLREILEDFLDEENIPEDVRAFFEEELDEGNLKQTATAN